MEKLLKSDEQSFFLKNQSIFKKLLIIWWSICLTIYLIGVFYYNISSFDHNYYTLAVQSYFSTGNCYVKGFIYLNYFCYLAIGLLLPIYITLPLHLCLNLWIGLKFLQIQRIQLGFLEAQTSRGTTLEINSLQTLISSIQPVHLFSYSFLLYVLIDQLQKNNNHIVLFQKIILTKNLQKIWILYFSIMIIYFGIVTTHMIWQFFS